MGYQTQWEYYTRPPSKLNHRLSLSLEIAVALFHCRPIFSQVFDECPSAFKVELDIEKLKSHISPGIDQIPVELIKAGGRTIRCAIHKLIISIWNKEELPEELK